jgi:predicted ATPase
MRIQVLGPIAVTCGNRPLALGGPRQQAVLAVLLVSANRAVSADRLIDEVWGSSPPASVRDALYTYVSNLRRLFGADRLVRSAGGYQLRVEPDEIDALLFGEEAIRARALLEAEPHRSAEILERGLGRWQGDAYQGVDLPSVSAEATRLTELKLGALEDLYEARLAVGRHQEAATELQYLCEQHPMRERLWGLRMIALYRDHRQAEALAAYQQVSGLLGEELGIEPSAELRLLEERILLQDPGLVRVAGIPHNLPARLTSFVGRQLELIEAGQLLAHARLVTLTGTGGSGKTRLGWELAREVLDEFADGVWLIDLASLNDPRLIAGTVAGVVGVKEDPDRSIVAGLTAFLDDRRVLLVLDNCEHLIEPVGRLCHELLEGAERLKILATSRELLGVPGEVVYELGGLSVPTPNDEPSALRVGSFDAVRLFVERGETARPGFRLSDGNAREVAQICRRLDGTPLALELAATRLRMLSLEQICVHLDDRFRLLTGGARTVLHRRQTLRAAIDWSYELLTGPEQRLFERLSVFAGAFTLEAAERVCAGGNVEGREMVDLLTRLVEKSLLSTVFVRSGDVRYRMLETIRHYARDRLAEAGETDLSRRRHAEFYRDLVLGGVAQIRDGQRAWMDRLEVEHDDLRRALDWAWEHGEADLGIDLGGALFGFWNIRFHHQEAGDWYAKLRSVSGDGISLGRARVLEGFAAFASEGEQSVAAGEQAVAMYRRLGENGSVWKALGNLGDVLVGLGETTRAKVVSEEAAAVMQAAGDTHGCLLQVLGHFLYEEGDHRRARELFEEGVELALRVTAPVCQCTCLQSMATLERTEGNSGRARTLLDQALESAHRMDLRMEECAVIAELAMVDRDEGDLVGAGERFRRSLQAARRTENLLDEIWFVVWWVRRLASLEALADHPRRAACLYGAVDAHAREAFDTWYDFERYAEPRFLDLIRAGLDQTSFTRAWNEGMAMARTELLDYALADDADGSVLASISQPNYTE